MLYILDPNLTDFVGHHYEYARSLAEAGQAAGLKCIVLANKDFRQPPGALFEVRPVYQSGMWATLPGTDFHSNANLRWTNDRFARDTINFLSKVSLQADDIVFIPTVTKAQVAGVAAVAEEFESSGARFDMMLRYPRSFFNGKFTAQAFARLEQLSNKMNIRLSTDSQRLADELKSLSRLPIHVYPIPHSDHANPHVESGTESSSLHFVSLGNARGEKGIAEIFRAILLCRNEIWAQKLRFTIQANNPSEDAVDAIKAFEAAGSPLTTLIKEPLNTEDYYGLLASSDVVLVPYHGDIYQSRTSGIFLEGTVAGKIIICTGNTWMSDLLHVFGHGVEVPDKSAEALKNAFKTVLDARHDFQQKALLAQDYYGALHTPENLIAFLSDRDGRSLKLPRGKRALILYPWGDAVNGRGGAVSVLHLRARYLEAFYDEVRILFPGENGGRISDRTNAIAYRDSGLSSRVLRKALQAFTAIILRRRPENADHLWGHLWPVISRKFADFCDEHIAWADDIFVEYSFFAPVVDKLSKKYQKSYILTQYDILSAQSAGVPLIHSMTRRLEFAALRLAPKLIVLNEADRDVCLEEGIFAEAIPAAVDTYANDYLGQDEAVEIIENFLDVPVAGLTLCIFVGSSYGPNIEAAQEVQKYAKSFEADESASRIVFIVAGACMAPSSSDNFYSLGRVEDVVLAALYKACSVVLAPMRRGTGTSIKSLEAIANGALVLSTSIGMRGTEYLAGRDCLIEDDCSKFPDRIKEIDAFPERFSSIREAGKRLGQHYDFRSVYKFYSSSLQPVRAIDNPEINKLRLEKFAELLPRALKKSDPELISFLHERGVDLQTGTEMPGDEDKGEFSSVYKFYSSSLQPVQAIDNPEINKLGLEKFVELLLQALKKSDPELISFLRERGIDLQTGTEMPGDENKGEFSEYSFSRRSNEIWQEYLSNVTDSFYKLPKDNQELDISLMVFLRKHFWEHFHQGHYSYVIAAMDGVFQRWPDFEDAEILYILGLSNYHVGVRGALVRDYLFKAGALGFTSSGWLFYHRGGMRIQDGDRRGYFDLLRALKLGNRASIAALSFLLLRPVRVMKVRTYRLLKMGIRTVSG